MRRQERRVVAVVFLRSLKKDGFFVIKRKNARKSPVKSKKAARNKQKSQNKTKTVSENFQKETFKDKQENSGGKQDMAEKFQMTQKGYDEAVKLLKYLQGTKRKEIVARIAEARSHGDLSENAEYDAARTEQSNNEMEIEELDYKIKNAEIVAENNDTSKVNIGNVVKVYDPDLEEEEIYEITGTTESNILENKISNVSPVGAALIGAKVGDRVTVRPDGGESYVLVVKEISLAKK